MTEEEYKPYFLESVLTVNDQYFILVGYPENDFDDDYFYEIHIEAPSIHFKIQDYIKDYICIEILSLNRLEIYYGSRYYQESFSDGEIEYKYYAFKKNEKTSISDWKPKVKDLQRRYNILLNEKMPAYIISKNQVENNFRSIYNNQISTIKNYRVDELGLNRPKVFLSLYNLLSNLYTQYYLQELITPPNSKTIYKDWKTEFNELEIKFNNLLNTDVEDYSLIKNQFINIYTNHFNRNFSDVKYNYKDVDEEQYILFFNELINKLKKT